MELQDFQLKVNSVVDSIRFSVRKAEEKHLSDQGERLDILKPSIGIAHGRFGY